MPWTKAKADRQGQTYQTDRRPETQADREGAGEARGTGRGGHTGRMTDQRPASQAKGNTVRKAGCKAGVEGEEVEEEEGEKTE